MDFAEFSKRRRLPSVPLFAVVGDEPYFKRRAVEKIVAALTQGPGSVFGVRHADMEGPEELRPASVSEILSDVRTPSLFGGGAVVVVWRADKLLSKAGGGEAILSFLESPGKGGTLVLDLRSLDGRTRLGRGIREKGTFIECKKLFDKPPPWKRNAPPHENPLAQWIAAEGKALGLRMGLAVAQGLALRVGNHPAGLREELEKLALYLKAGPGEPKSVSEEVLSESVGDYNEFGVFRLTDAVGARRIEEALSVARALFEQGLRGFGGEGAKTPSARVPTVLLERIHAKMSEIFRARSLLDEGASEDEVGKALGKHRAFLPALVAEARRYGPDTMHGILEALFRADLRLKSGADGRTEIERLLVEVLQGGQRPEDAKGTP